MTDHDRKRDREGLSQEPEEPIRQTEEYSEAEEDDNPQVLDDFLNESEPDDGEDLFGDDLDRDYREKSQFDQYSIDSADEGSQPELSREQRLVAEMKMKKRDRDQGTIPAAFLDDDDFMEETMPMRRRHKDVFQEDLDEIDDIQPLDHEELGDVKGQLSDYVLMEAPSRTIRNEFHRFLTSFINANGISVYGERIKQMCEGESQSLEIDYGHLCATNATIAFFLTNAPAQILPIFDEVAMEVVLSGFENYDQIHSEIRVRVTNLPAIETIRDLR
jgi:DNA replication licensing factor MCM2